MLEHARSDPDREVCALIGARSGQPVSYYPVDNGAPDPRRAFLMDPLQQLAAMRAMREADEELFGIFHSHPWTSAAPSATDREQAAYPGVMYFIAALRPDVELRAWHFDGEAFHAVDLRDAAAGHGTAPR